MKKHPVGSIVATCLAALMMLQISPIALAQETVSPESLDTATHESIYTGESGLYELTDALIESEAVEKREESVKYFRLKDGTMAAAIYDSPVHELGSDGTWKEIDNSLKDSGDELESAQRNIKVRFSKKMRNGKIYTIQGNGFQIKWALNGVYNADKQSKRHALKGMDHQKKLITKSESDLIVYEQVFPGVDLQYKLSGNSLKENIVLANRSAARSFSFDLKVKQLTAVLEDNCILLEDENGNVMYTMKAPYMSDAEGKVSSEIVLGLSGNGNHYTVTLTPDMAWLNSAAYPVVIDPVVGKVMDYHQIDNTFVFSARPNSNEAYQYGSVVVGRESSSYGNARGIYKFTLPTGITSSDRVVQANLNLEKCRCEGSGNTAVTVKAHQITSNIAVSTATWNSLGNNWNPTVLDSQVVTKQKKLNGQSKNNYPVIFDVTSAVQDWYQNGNNYGLALISDNENSAYQYASFFTSRFTNVQEHQKPSLVIQYVNQNGMESHLTYHSAGNGRMGVASVSDFTGNLFYAIEDAATSGLDLPVSLSHYFDNGRSSVAPADLLMGSARFGHNFRMNVYQRLIENDGTYPQLDRTGYPFCLLDADGTLHYFKPAVNGVYNEEYNSQFTLKINDANVSSKRYAVSYGDGIDYIFNTHGYMTGIKDTKTGKTASLTYYSGTARLKTITDGAGRSLNLTYNSDNYLSTITDPAGRVTTFEYYSDAYNNSYNVSNYLGNIIRPGNRVIHFRYTKGKLKDIVDSDGSQISFQYYDTGSLRRVKTITEYGKDTTMGNRLTFTYGVDQTKVSDNHGKSETMLFDSFGHTVNVADQAGNVVMGSYLNTENYNKNSLKYVSKLQSNVINYVSNGGFEKNLASQWSEYHDEKYVPSAVGTTPNEKYSGSQSLVLLCNDLIGRCGQQQTIQFVSHPNETYTLSTWVKAGPFQVAEGASGGVMLGFYYKTTDGKWNLNRKICPEVSAEWTRMSHTFTTPGDLDCSAPFRIVLGFENAAGSAWFDNVQMEEGAVANAYNLLDNGHFRDSSGTATPENWVRNNLESGDKISGGGFLMHGNRSEHKNLEQTVQVSGPANTAFTYGVWATGNAILQRNPNSDRTDGVMDYRDLSVRIRFVNTDGTTTSKYAHFQSRNPNKQFFSTQVMSDKPFTAVKIALLFNHQENQVVFDNVQLFKEASQSKAAYDNLGRLEEQISPNGEKTSYTYDGDSARIKLITYPDGTSEGYTYNSRHQVRNYGDTDNVITNYHYDADGHLTDTTVQKVGSTKTIISNKTAYANGYATTTTNVFGKTITRQTNQNTGTLTSITDPAGTKTNYTYDSNTDAVLSVQTGQSKNVYGYADDKLDTLGHNTTATPENTTSSGSDVLYSFEYDTFGNADKTYVGISKTNRFLLADQDYASNNGLLMRTTYGNGDYAEPVYDSQNRIIAQKYNGVEKYRWSYGSDSRIGMHDDLVNHMQYRYEYDENGRLIHVAGKPTILTGHPAVNFYNVFDTNGKLTQTKRRIGSEERTVTYTYSTSGKLQKSEYGAQDQTQYVYDALGRLSGKNQFGLNQAHIQQIQYGYEDGVNHAGVISMDPTTTRINQLTVGSHTANSWSDQYGYVYDDKGNIKTITKNGAVYATYSYDSLNQLVGAVVDGVRYQYTYDKGGNIAQKARNGVAIPYVYGNATWKDLLTGYNMHPITYDAIGNPLSYYNGASFTWEGRQLQTASWNGKAMEFRYNADGIRTEKVVNQVHTLYTVNGGTIVRQQTGSDILDFDYDATGHAVMLRHNGTPYYYVYNLQGDVVALQDASGAKVVAYQYDPWGKILSVTGTGADTIGQLNPLRYRGYYYDTETGFYYLQSRYYDPETGRFLNADMFASTGQGVLGSNMFAYCGNNPIIRTDPNGECWGIIRNFVSGMRALKRIFNRIELLIRASNPDLKMPYASYGGGKGNVYIVKENEVSAVQKTIKDTDVIVVDYRTDKNPNMQVRDSHKIHLANDMTDIARIMKRYNYEHPVLPGWNRSVNSIRTEWIVHNAAYIVGIEPERTAHVDLDNEAEGMSPFDFAFEYLKDHIK